MIFECKDCNRVFSRSHNLKRDQKTCKILPTQNYCDIYDIKFRKMKQKNKHMNEVHYKKMYICDICGKQFLLEKTLKAHLYTHKGKRNNKTFIYDPNENDVIIPSELKKNMKAISEIKKKWSAIRNFKIIGEYKLRHVYNIRLEKIKIYHQ